MRMTFWRGRSFFEIDFEKTYDCVQWGFLVHH